MRLTHHPAPRCRCICSCEAFCGFGQIWWEGAIELWLEQLEAQLARLIGLVRRAVTLPVTARVNHLNVDVDDASKRGGPIATVEVGAYVEVADVSLRP